MCFIKSYPHCGKAIFELKLMQIWLGRNFTYFYVEKLSEVSLLLVSKPIIG
jgi:hypothetical protein